MEHLLGSVIVNLDNSQVIAEMQAREVYDLIMSQVERVADVPNGIVTMKYNHGDRLNYYTFYYNHPNPADNGWQMVSLPADAPAELVEIAEDILRENWRQPARVLWIDDPERRN